MLKNLIQAQSRIMLVAVMLVAQPAAIAGQWLGEQVRVRSSPGDKGQMGAVDIGGVLMMGIAMVFLAVGFIMFPIVTDATDSLLAYQNTSFTAITDASFTGFTSVVGITPLLVLLGFLSAAVFSMFLGVKISKGAAGGNKLDLGAIVMLGLSIVFIAVGLIILPVALDGIAESITIRGSQTDSEAVTTAVGQTTANVTLAYELWNNSVAEVTSVSSNITETPAVSSYDSATNNLLLSSLSANTSRTITTVYNNAALIDGTASYTGLYPILLVTPLLILISFIGGAVVSGFFGIKKLGSGA